MISDEESASYSIAALKLFEPKNTSMCCLLINKLFWLADFRLDQIGV